MYSLILFESQLNCCKLLFLLKILAIIVKFVSLRITVCTKEPIFNFKYMKLDFIISTINKFFFTEDGAERQDRDINTTKLSSTYSSSTSKPTEMFTTAKSREVPLNVIIPIVIAVIALVFVIVILFTITTVLACLYITIREKYYKNLSFVSQNNLLEDCAKK